MFAHTVAMMGIAGVLVAGSTVDAGYYSTIDAPEESRFYSIDYEAFKAKLDQLKSIADPPSGKYLPLQERYLLFERLARDAPGRGGAPNLDTLKEQLNFSTVLIRRGRAADAVRFLESVYEDNKDNFLVLSHYATAHFLSKELRFERQSARLMAKTLEKWPKAWADVSEEQKNFVRSFGWLDDHDFDRYRQSEVYFERLIVNRLKEKELLAKKEPVPPTVDPIFLDAKNQPIRFLNEKGEFEAGAIAKADKEQMPHQKSVQHVEQLLIWMPKDKRLLWLLGEVLNASVMEYQDAPRKNQAIAGAHAIFSSLTDPLGEPIDMGMEEIKSRRRVIEQYRKANDPGMGGIPGFPDEEKKESPWWRIGVGFLAGAALGMFALWQIQEMRRRRQVRAAAKT
ncbi:MAG: hypothetical protein HY289_05280 [Planctomycetes bacterium]|nr:hypothetical protein [Planctomycetota bacterium]